MVKEITKFKRYFYFLYLEEKLNEIDKFIKALLKNKHTNMLKIDTEYRKN